MSFCAFKHFLLFPFFFFFPFSFFLSFSFSFRIFFCMLQFFKNHLLLCSIKKRCVDVANMCGRPKNQPTETVIETKTMRIPVWKIHQHMTNQQYYEDCSIEATKMRIFWSINRIVPAFWFRSLEYTFIFLYFELEKNRCRFS